MTTNTVKHTPDAREWQPIEVETKFKACLVEGCDGNAHSSAGGGKGWCVSHYERWRVHGDPFAGGIPRNAARNFLLAAIEYQGDECTIWPYTKDKKGYGITWVDGKTRKTHRFVCMKANGSPPSRRHHAAHYCGNASCITPRHLRWATPAENAADKIGHGTERRGERCTLARLSEDEAVQILALKGTERVSVTAERFGVSLMHVRRIQSGESWAHLSKDAATFHRRGTNGPSLPVEASTDKQAAGASRPTNSNSQASPPPADSAGEAPSSSPASPARHSDEDIPAFLRRDEGRGHPKRESVEA